MHGRQTDLQSETHTSATYNGVRLQKFVTEIARELCDKVN